MGYLKIFIFSLCGAGIITSIFKLLISNSSVKKSINIFLSMFIFLYTIIPIEKVLSNFKINENDSEYETISYTDIYKTGYDSIIIKLIENTCEKHNTSISFINVQSYIDNDNFLVVERIELELNDDEKKHDY